MTPWTLAIALAALALAAQPAAADAADAIATGGDIAEPCDILYIYTSPPRVDPHPECILTWLPGLPP